MTMYNMLHGVDPLAPALLKLLGITKDGEYAVDRFRDIHLNEDGTRIVMLTRTGGGNRRDYQAFFDRIRKHPDYLSDRDDDYDSTYAYIEFSVPEDALPTTRAVATGVKPPTLRELTERFTKEVETMTPAQVENDPRTRDLVKIVKEIVLGDGANKTHLI